ncbi:MAG: glutaredoxin 3 [Pseudomonadota bacterium]
MTKVTVYSRDFCPYCTRAIKLLKSRGVQPDVIDAGRDARKKQEMIKRSNGGRTFPQIFIGERHIGGCDDLMALDHQGGLDPLLSS